MHIKLYINVIYQDAINHTNLYAYILIIKKRTKILKGGRIFNLTLLRSRGDTGYLATIAKKRSKEKEDGGRGGRI